MADALARRRSYTSKFAEDVAVSDCGGLDVRQVKRVNANITLPTKGVAKLIAAVWTFQKKNPSRRVTGALLTTSGIGKEKGISFERLLEPGLVYWRTAARDGTDIEPIRSHAAVPESCRMTCVTSSAMSRPRCCGPLSSVLCGGCTNRPSPSDLRRDVEEQLVLPMCTARCVRDVFN